jgi:formiminoglutamase
MPVILSCPHGGLDVPSEVRDLLAIDRKVIHNECDLWVDQLFDFTPFGAPPLGKVTMPIARVLIDANRDPTDLANADGPVKTITSYGDNIYCRPLGRQLQRMLLERYWRPYHSRLGSVAKQAVARTKLFLDCHNMAQQGPSAYSDPGAARPLICLANLGDETGDQIPGQEETSCSAWLIRRSAELAEELFSDMALLEPEQETPPRVVAINQPFAGGYILRQAASGELYGGSEQVAGIYRPPAMMVEVNRGLFVGNQTTTSSIRPPNLPRIALVQQRLHNWLGAVLALL